MAAVRKLYQLLDREGDSNSGPQIIAVDHVRLDEAWFDRRMVEEWRGDLALVPRDWRAG